LNLRERLRDARVRDGGDQLLPDKRAKAEENAPDPLLKVQRGCGEGPSAKFDDENLKVFIKSLNSTAQC